MLGRIVTYHSLGNVDLCSRGLLWPNSTVFLITCAGSSEHILCVGSVCSFVMAKSLLILACQWMGLTLRLTGYID